MAVVAVQRVAKAATAASISIGSGDGWATPTAGNLIVITANADATVSDPAGYTAGPSVVDNNAVYSWFKDSAGTESTITLTNGANTEIVMTACEYSGLIAGSFDTSNTSTIPNSSGTTTTSVSITTTADGDLVIGVAGLADLSANPTGPSWTNSFVNQLTSVSPGALNVRCNTFYAELVVGAAGSYATACSWTNACFKRQELVLAFKAAADTPLAGPPGWWLPPHLLIPLVGRNQAMWLESAPSGQTFTQDLDGTVTCTGELTRQDLKPLAGLSTPSGALAKQGSKAFGATVTDSGALARQAQKTLGGTLSASGVLSTIRLALVSFAGSLSPAGALAKLASKPFAGSSTPAGAYTKVAGKGLSGTASTAGAVTKLVAKALAGTLTSSGVVSSTRVFLRSFAGTLSSSGAVSKQAAKALSGSTMPVAALTRAVSKALTSAVAAAGALAKLVAKPFAGQTTPTGTVNAIIPVIGEPGTLTATTTGPTFTDTTAAGASSPASAGPLVTPTTTGPRWTNTTSGGDA